MNTLRKLLPVLVLLVLCAVPVRAQNSFYSNVAFREISGLPSYPGSGATITVCSFPGSGLPCAPTTAICASPTDVVCASPNPFNADAFGNFGFWGKPGNYTITITGANLNSYSFTATVPPTLSGSLTVNGNLTVTGNTTLAVVTATSITDSGLTPGNCVQGGTGGLLTSTGSACGSSGGAVTTTGSPANNNLTQFSGATSITNGNLSGDATTSNTLAVTVAKVNGVAYPSSPATNTVPVVTASNSVAYVTVPNCLDTLGQHLNYNNSTFTFICGTSAPSNVNFGRNASVCSTGGGGGSTCSTTVNLSFAEPDTNYSVAAACVGPTQYPIIIGVSKGTSSVTVTISNGTGNMAQVSTCSELDVVVTGT